MGLIDDQGRRPPRRVNRPKWADYRRHFADTNPEETRADAKLVWGHQTVNVVLGPIGARFGQMAGEKAAARQRKAAGYRKLTWLVRFSERASALGRVG